MQYQQLVMENTVLKNEKKQLIKVVEQIKAQYARGQAIELFLAQAMSGFCAQPRAAMEEYGPEWVAEQSILTTNAVLARLEKAIDTPEGLEEPKEESFTPEQQKSIDDYKVSGLNAD